MTKADRPLVSIGVPVYNGEKGLVRALDGLLGQDYDAVEIIISDNGSTDATPQICKEYVRKDPRVQYHRSEKNLGGPWNFNRVFELSSGKYFMWAAHDDHREATFVSACVNKMEQNPDAVLCQVHSCMLIEGAEEVLCFFNLDSFDGVTGLVERYRETLKRFPAVAIYGLFRAAAVRKTRLFQKSIATDMAFAQELSIYGHFVQIPQVLFTYIGRAKWNTVHQDYRVFLGKDRKPWWYFPFVALFRDHWQRVAVASIPYATKCRLWTILVRHEIGQSVSKIMFKLVGRLCPERWKNVVGRAIYRHWMHNPNVIIACVPLYDERVIKPRLGWWK